MISQDDIRQELKSDKFFVSADAGRTMLDIYAAITGGDKQTNLTDLLADLLHHVFVDGMWQDEETQIKLNAEESIEYLEENLYRAVGHFRAEYDEVVASRLGGAHG